MNTFKNFTLLCIGLFCLFFNSSVFAQQWNGGNNPNDNIWRPGNVWIGVNNSIRPFHLRGEKMIFQVDRDRKDPGFGITRYSTGFQDVWKSYTFYVEGTGVDQGKFIIADWHDKTSGLSDARFVIDNVGRIGINSINPNAQLEVVGASSTLPLGVKGSATTGIQYDGPGGTSFAGAYMNGGKPFFGYKRDNSILGYHYIDSDNGWKLYMGRRDNVLSAYANGNVGINTTSMIGSANFVVKSPRTSGYGGMAVQIDGSGDDLRPFYSYGVNGSVKAWHYFDNDVSSWKLYNGGDNRIVVTSSGRVGIGQEFPNSRSKMHINGSLLVSPGKIYLSTSNNNDDVDDGMGLERVNNLHMSIFSDQTISFSDSDTKESKIFINVNTGRMGIGTSTPTSALQVAGTTTTNVLTITGGADIAEPFEITAENEQVVEAGAIVVIDEINPGKLKLSQQAHDKKVIGIISGANGVNPGMVLSQEEALGSGENVAISGRVYVKANASNGTIQPGDFLTTSETAGEAMKVSDLEQARGAIIGKAMSPINEKGYVLVFVSLQ